MVPRFVEVASRVKLPPAEPWLVIAVGLLEPSTVTPASALNHTNGVIGGDAGALPDAAAISTSFVFCVSVTFVPALRVRKTRSTPDLVLNTSFSPPTLDAVLASPLPGADSR